MNVPTSTRGLTPTQRCRDLARRELMWRRVRPVDFLESKFDCLICALHQRGFDALGSFGSDGSGIISVFQVGGGYHRDSRPREYKIRRGYVVSITRPVA